MNGRNRNSDLSPPDWLKVAAAVGVAFALATTGEAGHIASVPTPQPPATCTPGVA
jgi:hypothetical protein